MSYRALAALTVVLALVTITRLLVPAPTSGGAGPDRRVLTQPVDGVRTLRWRRGQAEVVVERTDDGWRMVAPAPGPAEAAVVDDLLGVLTAARWQRRVGGDQVGPAALAVLEVGGAALPPLRLGPVVPGLEAAWISDGRRSWLVDAWVVRALDRPALALRATAPLTVGAAELAGLELHLGTAELIGAGRPLRARGVLAGGDVVLGPDAVRALVDALAAIRVVGLPGAAEVAAAAADQRAPVDASVRVLGAAGARELRVVGACAGGGALADGPAGWLCVDAAALTALAAVVARIQAEPTAVADPVPVRAAPTALTLPSGVRLVFSGGGASVAEPGASAAAPEAPIAVDRDRAAAFLALLSSPHPVQARAGRRAGATLAVETADGTVALELGPAGPTGASAWLGQPGLATVWQLGVDEAALLAATVEALRDRVLWAEDPTRLLAVRRDGIDTSATELERWRAAAQLQVRRWASPAERARLTGARATARVELVFAAPPTPGAAEVVHVLERVRATAAGCLARVDGALVELTTATCP
ncbi:MAG: hypothetical protein KA297_07065 [Kofleriaceae bacterium]|nr:hypothetical protein [Kofleriaceae bacterium]